MIKSKWFEMVGNISAISVLILILFWPSAPSKAQPFAPSGLRNDAVLLKPLTNSGLQTILSINTNNSRRALVTCVNTVNALSAFAVTLSQANNLANPATVASLAADFTSPVAPMVRASASLVTLGVATGWFIIDTGGTDNLSIAATSGSAGGSVISCWAAVSS